ncbi:MAG: HlyD family secretion protein [Candidatus Methylomirabilia bacterium]
MNPPGRLRIVRGLLIGLGVFLLVLAGSYGARVLNSGSSASLVVSGTIEATQVAVSAKYAGRIAALLVREGERVRLEQLLVRLEDEELRAGVRRSEAALRSAQAELRDLLAGARKEEIDEARAAVERARAQLEDLLAGARAEELEEARQTLGSATATREWAERDFGRAQELFAKELVAAQEVDQARRAYEVAVAQQRAASERLDLLLAGPRPHQVHAARAQLKAAQDRLSLLLAGARPYRVEATRAQVSQAEAALALARSRMNETRIIAPITGVVLRKNLEIGETANPGVSILSLVDPSDLWLRAYVPESEIGRITVGQPARITIDSFEDRAFPGKIIEIASEAEFTPKNVQTKRERANLVFRIKIGVENPEGILKPGMPADAEILF